VISLDVCVEDGKPGKTSLSGHTGCLMLVRFAHHEQVVLCGRSFYCELVKGDGRAFGEAGAQAETLFDSRVIDWEVASCERLTLLVVSK
jgi:hypothetical protein